MIKNMAFLSAAEDRESFFARISQLFPPLDERYQLIEKAYNDAEKAFKDKLREDGSRYFEHIRAVALILIVYLRIKDYHLIVAALLHDIVEDCDEWTIERVKNEYVIEIARLLEWLSKEPVSKFDGNRKLRDAAYHSRFEAAPREFFLVKLPDRLHNLITLWSCTTEKRQRKIEETERYYLPYAEKHLILLHELEEAISLIVDSDSR